MKKYIFSALCALALIACAKSDEDMVAVSAPAPETIYASFEEPTTRTYVEQDKYLRWHAEDEISFFSTTYNLQYCFAGNTGDNNGSFTKVTTDLVTGNALANNYAVYPYAASTAISDEGVISVTLPATQAYAENSFGRGANTMVAATNGTMDNVLRFKNAGGYLKLQLYGTDVTVKSIALQGNKGEKIAGEATITAAYGNDPVVTMADTATDVVTIDCGEGVTLSNDTTTPTTFWFVLPETTFAEGFTVTVTDPEGGTFEKSTSNSFTIDRNMIQPMATLEIESEAQIAIPNNEIWYKSVDGNIRVPYTTTGFGAKYMTNEYNTEIGYWIISFDSDVTTIPAYAFRNSNASFGITEILLPPSLTTIESNAFYYCLELQEVYIPKNVNTIKDYAFNGCSGIHAFYGKYASSDNRCLIKDGVIISFATSGIKDYSTPSDAKAIGKYAFYGATISSLIITDNITTIGYAAFSSSLLETIDWPKSITTIPNSAFSNCYNLVSCNIPLGVTEIGSTAFQNCYALKTIILPNTIKTIGESAFRNAKIDTLYVHCNIPDYNDASYSYAYFYSTNISHAIIGEQVTSIGRYAFAGSKIQKLTLGENISSIGSSALLDCKQLTEIYCKNSMPPFAENSFGSLSSINKIYVPASDDDSIITAYKSALGWSNYAAYIEEYEFVD